MKNSITVIACFLAFAVSAGIATIAAAQSVTPETAGLRGTAMLPDNEAAPRKAQVQENERQLARNYPEQPPVIPHKTEGYQVDKNANKCLSCHARARVAESGAPMVSITHFMDRDGQFLAAVSPRRYFCNQCHVVQARVSPPIRNTFIDIDTLLAVEGAN